MTVVNWDDISTSDAELVNDIVNRATRMKACSVDEHLALTMDIVAVHVTDVPIKLGELLYASDTNFLHDVGGIRNHIDRDTGKLQHNFCPRYAKKGVKPDVQI